MAPAPKPALDKKTRKRLISMCSCVDYIIDWVCIKGLLCYYIIDRRVREAIDKGKAKPASKPWWFPPARMRSTYTSLLTDASRPTRAGRTGHQGCKVMFWVDVTASTNTWHIGFQDYGVVFWVERHDTRLHMPCRTGHQAREAVFGLTLQHPPAHGATDTKYYKARITKWKI